MKTITVRIWFFINSVNINKKAIAANEVTVTEGVRLDNIQTLLTGNIARNVFYPANFESGTPFLNEAEIFANSGHNIYQFYVKFHTDNSAATAQAYEDIMRMVNERTVNSTDPNNRANKKFLLSYDIDTSNSNRALFDRLSNGQVVYLDSNICPNGSFIDVSDPAQRNIFLNYHRAIIDNLKLKPNYKNIVGFWPAWGAASEGDGWLGADQKTYSGCKGRNGTEFNNDQGYLKVSAGYSESMLNKFKVFYKEKQNENVIPRNAQIDALVNSINPLTSGQSTWPLPQPRSEGGRYSAKSKMYAYFLMFRKSLHQKFNAEMMQVIAEKAPDKAKVSFCYLPAHFNGYANSWTRAPGTDFCAAQLGVGVYTSHARPFLETDFVGHNDYDGQFARGSKTDKQWFEDNMRLTHLFGGNTSTFFTEKYKADGITDLASSVNKQRANHVLGNPLKYNSQVAVLFPHIQDMQKVQ